MNRPIDPRFSKYIGRKNPTFRSSWESAFAVTIDRSLSVKGWASEPFSIQYYNPVKKRLAMYWPDFVIEYTNGFILIVEIKPMKEAVMDVNSSLYDRAMLLQNAAKWQAVSAFAKARGYGFRVYTERELAGILQKKTTNKAVKPRAANKTRGTKR